MSQKGTVYWTELISSNVESSKKFYTKVFGWETDAMPMPSGVDYYIFKNDSSPVAGLLPMDCTSIPEGTPNHWFTYFAVDDAAAACEAAISEGGSVIREPFFVPGVGSHALLAGADGSPYGIVQPDSQ